MNPVVAAHLKLLRDEFNSLAYAGEEFPMLTRWGVPDYGQTIHSLGSNYLATLGRQAGCWAMTEYPIGLPAPLEHAEQVRADAAWWAKDEHESCVFLAEFERIDASGAGKLADKARNLLAAHRALPSGPRLLVLMGWKVYGGPIPSATAVRQVMADGCKADDGSAIKGLGGQSAFLFAVADLAVGPKDGLHRLREVLLP